MAVTVAQFRLDYPEFSVVTDYPDSAVTYFLNLAVAMLNSDRWGNQLDIATELYIAHNLAIEKRAQLEAVNGEVPGTTTGPISSKSVDKVSVGFDVGSAVSEGAGHWNLTVYGTRFYKLAKMFGASPLFIGLGFAPVGSGMAWPGPNTTPGMSNFGN